MTPYPDTFPMDEIKAVVAIVQSNTISAKSAEFAHDAWVIIGYGMKYVLGSGTPLVAGAMPPHMEQMHGLDALKSMIIDNPDVVQAIPPAVWKAAIQFLLEVLLKAL